MEKKIRNLEVEGNEEGKEKKKKVLKEVEIKEGEIKKVKKGYRKGCR